jgi:hypothetical protein
LADETKKTPSPYHLVYTVDSSASSARFFTDRKVTNGLCLDKVPPRDGAAQWNYKQHASKFINEGAATGI